MRTVFGKTAIVAGALAALVCLGGCFLWPVRKAARQTAEVAETALAATPGMQPLTMYYIAGLLVILVGVAVFAFGGKATGGILAACGAGIAYFGQTMILYPWMSLVAVLAAAVVAAFIAYDRRRHRDTVKELVPVVQAHPELKPEIAGGDPEKQARIRPVVNSAKKALRAEGRIA